MRVWVSIKAVGANPSGPKIVSYIKLCRKDSKLTCPPPRMADEGQVAGLWRSGEAAGKEGIPPDPKFLVTLPRVTWHACPRRLAVRSRPFQGRSTGSIPVGDTISRW